eukprot:Awhi_evm1s5295
MDCEFGTVGTDIILQALHKVADEMIKYPSRKVVVNLSNGATSRTSTDDTMKTAEYEITQLGGVVIRAAGNR